MFLNYDWFVFLNDNWFGFDVNWNLVYVVHVVDLVWHMNDVMFTEIDIFFCAMTTEKIFIGKLLSANL